MMHDEANNVALLLGGNQGNRYALMQQATELIRQRIGSVVAASRMIETEPWGSFVEEQGGAEVAPFLNMALLVQTPMTAEAVLAATMGIEALLGRTRYSEAKKKSLYSSRPMDIDIIFYNNDVIDTIALQVPHPRMHLRRFVLEPLAEIMPDYVHPVLHCTVAELLSKL